MQSSHSTLLLKAPLSPERRRAFTFIELAVVIAVVALLVILALPVQGKAGRSGHAVLCANNLKQLMAGYLMYAQDNNDLALGPYTSDTVPAWCSGFLGSPPDAIDETFVRESPTYRYLASIGIFRCPSDVSSFFSRGQLCPRNRSYAVNGFMGDPTTFISPNSDIFKSARRLSDITVPGPSAVYVLLEEHQNSINDSHFLPFRDLHQFGNQAWLDAPAGRHGNAAGLAYADGHSDIHRWQDSNLQGMMGSSIPVYAPSPRPGPREFAWFTNHIAAFAR